jgi:hypothetical protein
MKEWKHMAISNKQGTPRVQQSELFMACIGQVDLPSQWIPLPSCSSSISGSSSFRFHQPSPEKTKTVGNWDTYSICASSLSSSSSSSLQSSCKSSTKASNLHISFPLVKKLHLSYLLSNNLCSLTHQSVLFNG